MILNRRLTCSTQPQTGLAVDWSNPLTTGLSVLISGSSRNEIVSQKPLKSYYTSNLIEQNSTQYGMGFISPLNGNASPEIYIEQSAATINAGKSWTIAALFEIDPILIGNNTVGSREIITSTDGTDSNTHDRSLGFNIFQGNLSAKGYVYPGIPIELTHDIPIPLGTKPMLISIVVSCGNGVMRLWANGIKSTTEAAVTNNGYTGYTNPVFRVGNSQFFKGIRYLQALKIEGLIWSDVQAKSYHANPWQFFAPTLRRSFALTSGALGPSSTPRIRRVPQIRQPQFPVRIDWSNPDSAGLILAVNSANGLVNAAGDNGVIAAGGTSALSYIPLQDAVYASGGMDTAFFTFTPKQTLVAATILSIESKASIPAYQTPWEVNRSENDYWPYGGNTFYVNTFADRRYASAVFAPIDMAKYVVAARGSNVADTHAAFVNGKKIASATSPFVCSPTIRIGVNFQGVSRSSLRLMWDRALSDEAIARISANPWQIFAPTQLRFSLVTGTISRPGSDIAVSGWTYTGSSLASSIGESVVDDSTWTTSPPRGSNQSATVLLDLPLLPGSYNITLRGISQYTGAGVYMQFLSATDQVVGSTNNAALTTSYNSQLVPLVITGQTATKVRLTQSA